mmetsp:Transcript_20671/g.34219  ORF Transcript_20671/g.34219 Transcript_20671/m.34219 type:complete len:194 (-) Transcript_20671:527-1108(-)
MFSSVLRTGIIIALVLMGTPQKVKCLSIIPHQTKPKPPFQLQRIDHVVLRCHDFDQMFRFYTGLLGCTVDHENDVGRFGGALTHLRAGDAYIDLLAYDVDSEEGKEALLRMHSGGKGVDNLSEADGFDSSKSTLDHLCLRVDPFDETAILTFFKEHDVKVVGRGPRKGADGVGPSIYVEDTEGNVIELKGPPE